MIYCGIHNTDHTAAEWAACLASVKPKPANAGDEDGE